MPSPRYLLHLTVLEDRTALSAVALGDAWPDANSLTLSFAPDSARFSTDHSTLFDKFNKIAKTENWQFEILKAFQTWASVTNLNVGLVADSGDPFGTPGDIQGDYRFGDIRIGARLLSMDSLANAVPFDWSSGTWSGDVLFNSGVNFGINPTKAGVYDLFTTALHEAGHTFGLDHSTDPLSVMAEDYSGTKSGLALSDIATIQMIYGRRLPDRFEGTIGNDSWDTATVLSGNGNLSVAADITTNSDADYYRFLTPASGAKFAVRLQTSGLSLLTSRVTVFNAAGQVVGSDVSTDPTSGDLEVKVPQAQGGSWYTVMVEAARSDVFGIGRYQLSVVYKDSPVVKSNYMKDTGTNDTAATADALNPDSNNGWQQSEGGWFSGVIENRNDVDYYRVTAPADADGSQALLVQIRGLNPKGIAPKVDVFDAAMNPLPVQVVGSDGSSVSIQTTGLVRGQSYFVRVHGNGTDDTNGNYRVSVDFTDPKTTGLDQLQVGTLAPGAKTATGHVTLTSSGLVQFGLNAVMANGTNGATITLTLTDAPARR